MGLFKKKQKKEEIPKLPELPEPLELPKLPEVETSYPKNLPQLPQYPSNTLGNQLSQNTIKEAVTGKKEGEVGAANLPQLHKIKSPLGSELHKISPIETPKKIEKRTKSKKPVFIRIDKFEESLDIFEETKNKIMEMEKMLIEIKELKEKEEKELSEWEAQIQTIKNQTEKVERDIFSKIE